MHRIVTAESPRRELFRLRYSHSPQDEILARSSRGGEVYNRVPETHQGKDDAGCICVGQRDGARVHEAVDAIDRGWHPGHQQRHEEQQCDFGVPPSRAVGLHRCIALAPLHGDHAYRMWPGLS